MTSTRSTAVSALALFSVLVFGVAGLSVSGNRVLDSTGKPVLLRGVDRPSLEWTAQGESLSLGDYQLMKTKWNANVVRLSLNQDFWFAGSAYQATVDQQVTWIQQVGMYVILDLHWSDPSNSGYAGQQNMADRYSINFWSQVAAKYKNNLNVLFELYNEPHDVSWPAWLNGDGGSFVGMQQLYNAVRAAGAQNIVIVNGLNWAYDLTGVGIGYALTGTNIMYATHPYNYGGKLAGDWFGGFLYLAATYPVIMTEFGQYCADDGYVQALLQQANAYGIHWTAWAWYVSGCGFPSIISDWNGNPTSPVGLVVQNFLLQGGNATAGPVGGSTTTGGGSSTTGGGGGSPTSSPPATNGVIIYDDALQNSWQDWSWATHSLSATPARSGSYSISFNLDQYKALYFHAPSPFYPNTYNSVQFWINGGTSGGQSIYVQAYDTSSTPAPVGWQIYLPVSVAANSWVQEIILFSSFGLASNQQISGFVIVSTASNNVVYVDDISVQPVAQATSAPTTAAATAVPTTVKITAAPTTPAPTTTSIPSTARATTPAPTPTTSIPTTVKTTTSTPSTATPTTPAPTTTAAPTTIQVTTSTPTTAAPTTTTAAPATTARPTTTPTTKKPATTKVPTTKKPTTAVPTTLAPTTAEPTSTAPTTIVVTTSAPTTTAAPATTVKPTATPTTKKPATTKAATTKKPTAAPTTTSAPTAAPTTTAAPVPTTQAPVPTTPAPVVTTQASSQGCSATVVESIQSTSTAQLTITNTGLLPIKQLLFTIVGSISGSWNIVPLASLVNTYTIPDWAINQLTPGASATQYGYNYQGLLPTVVVISVSC